MGPTQPITFLGITINTVSNSLTLGEDKIKRLKQQLIESSSRTRPNKQQLQSLAGSLNYACQAVRGERFFVRRILDTIQLLKQQRHRARLSQSFHSNVQWWVSCLSVFNDKVCYNDVGKEHVHVDARTESPKIPCGRPD